MANINRGEGIPKTNSPKDFCAFAINSMMIVPMTIPRSIGYTKNRIGIIPTLQTLLQNKLLQIHL